MCGIVGAINFGSKGFSITRTYLEKMRDVMAHRGPDGTGIWISPDGDVGLGHRRLAIVDLSSAANQPMSNSEDSVWVVFNGEIYNHAAIRSELEKTGKYTWKTDHSDTEVLLHSFEEWGIDCVKRFRGMFAFAIWDVRERELWLVRDRIGIKPVYYSIHHGRMTFASEVKALLEDDDQPREIDVEALYHYLTFLTTPSPMTMFTGIRKLPPATWVRVRQDGSTREHRYWDVWDHTTPLQGVSDDEVAQELIRQLRESVQLRKMADVPVGVFLSGGLDSSANLALFAEDEGTKVKAFSVDYDPTETVYPSEMQHARTVAAHFGAEHYQRTLREHEFIEFLDRMVWLQDEPIADPVCFPVFCVSELARMNGVIVCQVGEGSDELFWGYPRWRTHIRLARINHLPIPAFTKRAGMQFLAAAGKAHGYSYEALHRSAAGAALFWGNSEGFPNEHKLALLNSSLRKDFGGSSSWDVLRPIRDRFQEKAWERSDLNWMSYCELNMRLPELLLMRVDKMGMGASIEARVPFLDHRFVEFAMSIPSEIKMRGGIHKAILKRAVAGIIPDDVIHRRKQGFGAPVNEWMQRRLANIAKHELGVFCREQGVLDHSAVTKVLQSGRGSKIWYLLNLALWWRKFIARVPAGEPLGSQSFATL